MQIQRRACIDVGTNSVKLLVADVCDSSIVPVLECSEQTRLGTGFFETHRLRPGPIAATAKAVAGFCGLARSNGAVSCRVIGTSAARDAVNRDELADAILDSAGVSIETISGDMEADLAFRGVNTTPGLAGHSLLILDVGGGSTEFIFGRAEAQYFRNSYRLGSVRLFERLRLSDPPGLDALDQCRAWLADFLRQNIDAALKPALGVCSPPAELIGTGGTATILARMEAGMEDFDRGRIEAAPIALEAVSGRLETQWQMPLTERRKITGLPPNRADVILTGMAIYEAIMREFDFKTLRVSTRGLRFAALLG